MSDTPQCPDCQAEMEAGFVPDFTHMQDAHSAFQTLWHPGEPPAPLELCAGDTETTAQQMRDIAREIAESCDLPFIETSKAE